uniref:Uncharacterized protein n=1 Tax=Arundo donax TaxID=35708 RepID=A0A0A9DH53_ARUDO
MKSLSSLSSCIVMVGVHRSSLSVICPLDVVTECPLTVFLGPPLIVLVKCYDGMKSSSSPPPSISG